MRKRANTVLVLVALAFGVFFLANRYVIARPAPAEDGKRKWEYGHLYASYCNENNDCKASFLAASTPAARFDEIQSSYDGLGALNKLGADGWELVGIIQKEPGTSAQPEYILKRAKP